MPQYYSFKTEITTGDNCFVQFSNDYWITGVCKTVRGSFDKEAVTIEFGIISKSGFLTRSPGDVASRTAFLEWQSRLMDCARDQFKFKGNMDKMFGPDSYSNWIPFYKVEMSPSNAYMQGMGLIDLGTEE
jgi:hypothetical protein